ncbi:lacto-N-neotetraose biosynthesis glycosyl transferase LgtA [Neisseria meningitidis]|nr:hypothetical protein NEIPOLOT_02431 [Neisseria polysaccharea ATCC 43768]RGA87753.1 lacto-N-neotetraose biosynthesis glycosyl transferase LgtA [Neisseria meningitidis]RJR81829.1 lacto-N-neotetraose biosynthesis glycosyl transferase LgtA [Neisseria meningitidis]RNJ88609.1 lacto-N-neotetraose biosynthesis glycosyl transferase LgtA [Neisseria meningitidis]RNK52740.1 lacto-N-neotetraose biosynthesis glycosyl transferase LgtA [Neisseria meningitidis]
MPSEAFRRHRKTGSVSYRTRFLSQIGFSDPPALSRFESDLPYKQASDGIIVN